MQKVVYIICHYRNIIRIFDSVDVPIKSHLANFNKL